MQDNKDYVKECVESWIRGCVDNIKGRYIESTHTVFRKYYKEMRLPELDERFVVTLMLIVNEHVNECIRYDMSRPCNNSFEGKVVFDGICEVLSNYGIIIPNIGNMIKEEVVVIDEAYDKCVEEAIDALFDKSIPIQDEDNYNLVCKLKLYIQNDTVNLLTFKEICILDNEIHECIINKQNGTPIIDKYVEAIGRDDMFCEIRHLNFTDSISTLWMASYDGNIDSILRLYAEQTLLEVLEYSMELPETKASNLYMLLEFVAKYKDPYICNVGIMDDETSHEVRKECIDLIKESIKSITQTHTVEAGNAFTVAMELHGRVYTMERYENMINALVLSILEDKLDGAFEEVEVEIHTQAERESINKFIGW